MRKSANAFPCSAFTPASDSAVALPILERARTRFQEVVVRGDGTVTEFQVEGAVHAWRHELRYLSMAWGAMAAAALLGEKRPPRRILMLGLAGGTVFRILRHLLPEAVLTAVEIDREILDLARRHMRLDDLGARIHVADARDWLARNRRSFDVVIDDCYLAGPEDVFRPHAGDQNVRNDLLRAVAPGGLLVVNLVTGAGHRRLQSDYRKWFRANFNRVRGITAPDTQNEILVGGDEVAAAARLKDFAFTHPADRKRWRDLKVRKIG